MDVATFPRLQEPSTSQAWAGRASVSDFKPAVKVDCVCILATKQGHLLALRVTRKMLGFVPNFTQMNRKK